MKGRRLPWQAFESDPIFRPALLAFATFGLRQRVQLLKKALASKRPMARQKRARLEAGLARAEEELKRLGELGVPRPDVLSALERTLAAKLEDPAAGQDGFDDSPRRKGLPQHFDAGDQASLFCRFSPAARQPEGEFSARDVANIGWSTKLALRYLRHLGTEVDAIKPWAVHALRCMFNIRKSEMRGDLRNHAVDAFLVAHFDARVLRPAFNQLRGAYAYESLYDLRVLDAALSHIRGAGEFLRDFKNSLNRLEAVLPTIATAHRADHRWNPGDEIGGGYGALGGENIYTFRPTLADRTALTEIAAKAGKKPKGGSIMTYEELLTLMLTDPANEEYRKLRDTLLRNKSAKVRYRSHLEGRMTELNMQTALPLHGQPGAFINAESKFAIIAASPGAGRRIISVAEFTKMDSAERAALFDDGRPIYRRGDTVVSDGQALVVTGLLADGRLITYPIDSASREEGKVRISIPQRATKSSVVRFASDVLGRRLHRLRKSPGGLKPVPYSLRGE
jgi:hypothetical protein